MSEPHDKLLFDLTPNAESDDPRITKAVEAAVRRLAARHGLKVDDPGQIDPTAKENPARVEKITRDTAPKLVEFSRTERDVTVAEETTPKGRVKRRVERIGQRTTKLSFSLRELASLAQPLIDGIGEMKDWAVGVATKVGAWIGSLLGPRSGEK